MAQILSKLTTTEAGIKPLASGNKGLETVAKILPGVDALALADRLKKSGKKHIRCLWSITPSGMPHLGHSVPIRMLAQLSQIDGVHVSLVKARPGKIDTVTSCATSNPSPLPV